MKVDLMMSDFAGGASGFPMTFSGGKFTGNTLFQSDARSRHGTLLNALQINTKMTKTWFFPAKAYNLTGKPDLQITDYRLKFPAQSVLMGHERNTKRD